jgi:hypothetical protein
MQEENGPRRERETTKSRLASSPDYPYLDVHNIFSPKSEQSKNVYSKVN